MTTCVNWGKWSLGYGIFMRVPHTQRWIPPPWKYLSRGREHWKLTPALCWLNSAGLLSSSPFQAFHIPLEPCLQVHCNISFPGSSLIVGREVWRISIPLLLITALGVCADLSPLVGRHQGRVGEHYNQLTLGLARPAQVDRGASKAHLPSKTKLMNSHSASFCPWIWNQDSGMIL